MLLAAALTLLFAIPHSDVKVSLKLNIEFNRNLFTALPSMRTGMFAFPSLFLLNFL